MILLPNVDAEIAPLEVNIVEKGSGLDASKPPLVTVIGSYVALTGIVAVSDVAEEEVTTPRTFPKFTILLDGVVLKLVPVTTTLVPRYPVKGETFVIVGTWVYPVPTMHKSEINIYRFLVLIWCIILC